MSLNGRSLNQAIQNLLVKQLTVENQDTGDNPVISSSSTSKYLMIDETLTINKYLKVKGDGSAHILFKPNIATQRDISFQDKNIEVADNADVILNANMNALLVANLLKTTGVYNLSQSIDTLKGYYAEGFEALVGDNIIHDFLFEVPVNSGGKKLYAYDIKTRLVDADDNNFIAYTTLYGIKTDGTWEIIDADGSDTKTVSLRTQDFSGTPLDCSAYEYITYAVYTTVGTEGLLGFRNPILRYFYDT